MVLGLFLTKTSYASEYWLSTFNEDSEGWEVYLGTGNDFTDVVYNESGYICFTKNIDFRWFFVKLDWFDWSELYGGIISFDIKLTGEGEYKEVGSTVILDLPGELGTYFFADIPLKPEKDVWTTYKVPILNDIFTRYQNPGELLSDYLGDLRGMDIRGDLLSGAETACIDNVKISKFAEIGIDVKPGSYPNCFNLNGKGVIPVAILGSADFDVENIDTETLRFNGLEVQVRGKKEKTLCHLEDVSGDFSNIEGAPDGNLDLVCQFEDNPFQWISGDGHAELIGELYNGLRIKGTDTICIVP
jgi:hypothetical protein